MVARLHTVPPLVGLGSAIAVVVRRAARSQQTTLISITVPVSTLEPTALFAAASGAATLWQRPAHGEALVGAGAAATLAATGAGSLGAVAARWRALAAGAVVGGVAGAEPLTPLALGGFAFDQLAARSNLWAGFPDALLTAPRLLFRLQGDAATLTLSALVGPTDDPDAVAADLVVDAARWLATAQTDSRPYFDRFDPTSTGKHRALAFDGQDPPSRALAVQGQDRRLALSDLRPGAEWRTLVARTAAAIREGRYQKVVLARGVRARATGTIAVDTVLRRLAADYPGAYVFAVRRGDRTFLGATPEQLARVAGGVVETMALAGSAPRGADEADDARLGAELLASAKNGGEHAIVAAAIQNGLAPLCSTVRATSGPDLLRLPNVQHLRTAMQGDLLPGRDMLDVVAALHPTPAVGGFPRESALAAIRTTEHLDRGWYAGPVGWVDGAGDGEFAVALRSAVVRGDAATLFAGCGIVGASDPDAEWHEAAIKLRVMVGVLGDNEGAQP